MGNRAAALGCAFFASLALAPAALAAPPVNDDFGDALPLTGATGTVSATNVDATTEAGEPAHHGTGAASVWYVWTAPENGLAVIDTVGSGFDTVLAVYTGSDLSALTVVASDDDSGGASTSRVTFDATAATVYRIAVAGFGGAVGNFTLNWTTRQTPENDHFASARALAEAGTLETSNIGATLEPGEPNPGDLGGASLWFTWTAPSSGRLELHTLGSEIDTIVRVYQGSSLDTLEYVAHDDNSADPAQGLSRASFVGAAGTTYRIAVYGKYGAQGKVVLNWQRTPPPNDDLANGEWLWSGDRGSVDADNFFATKETGEPSHAGASGGASVWYFWRAPLGGTVLLETIESDFDTLLAVYSGYPMENLAPVASDDDSGYGNTSVVTFEAVQDAIYRIAVDGKAGATGRIDLDWVVRTSAAPANDDFASAEQLIGASGSVGGSNANAGKEAGEPDHAGNLGGASVWYRWTAPADGSVKLVLSGDELDRVLGVYTGDSLAALTAVAEGSRSRPLWVFFGVTAGTEYSIAVDSAHGGLTDLTTGAFQLDWVFFDRPANDNFSSPEAVTGRLGQRTETNGGATREAGEPDHAGYPGGASVWYAWTAPVTEDVRVNVRTDDFDSLLAVYRGDTLAAADLMAENDNAPGGGGSEVIFSAVAGETYRIAVDGYSGWFGGFELRWRPAGPLNDNFASSAALSGPAASATTSNQWATKEPGEPDHAGNPGGASVWYRWAAPWHGTVTLDTRGSDVHTLLAVYSEGGDLGPLDVVASSHDSRGNASVTFGVGAGVNFTIAVDGFNAGSGPTTGNLSLNLRFKPENDDLGSATSSQYMFFSTWLSTAGATAEPGEPAHAGQPARASVWHRWTAPTSGRILVTTRESDVPTRLAVYRGSTMTNLVRLASSAASPSEVTLVVTEGTRYAFAIDTATESTGLVALTVEQMADPPEPVVERGTIVGGTAVPVTLHWDGPTGPAIDHYEIQRNTDAGWINLASPTRPRAVVGLRPAGGYEFRVRAVNAAGQATEWASGSSFSVSAVQERNRAVVYRGAWRSSASASAYGGAVRYTTESGARARLAFTGRSVAWIAEKGRSRGRAAVFVDGVRVAVVDLYAAASAPRRAVFTRTWNRVGSHTIEVRALGTKHPRSGGRRVDLDAFVVLG